MGPEVGFGIGLAGLAAAGWCCWRARGLKNQLAGAEAGRAEAERRVAELEEAVAAGQAKAEEAEKAASKKLHRARHDLMGCLNIVSGYRELIAMDDQQLTERHRDFLARMGEGVEKSFQAADSLIAEELEKSKPAASAASARQAR